MPELSDDQKRVLREKATEPPFSGKWLHNTEKGMYVCADCGNELFSSDTKFDSGSGWPSYSDVASSAAVEFSQDRSLGMVRTEISCANCGGHLGHVFDDGPKNAGGKRYCINSLSLDFKKHPSTE